MLSLTCNRVTDKLPPIMGFFKKKYEFLICQVFKKIFLQICNKYFDCRHDGKNRPILTKFISLTYYQSQQLQDINRKPPRPPITSYRHVKPLDRKQYHQHHRRAHSANGEQWRGVI